MVMADEDARSLLVVVPNDQLSLAIGRQGQNVRLASKLIGWRIDVKSEQRYANLSDPGYQSLLGLKGVDESLADQLLGKGITSSAVLAGKSVADLMVIRSIDEAFAEKLIEEAMANPFTGQIPAGAANGGSMISSSEAEAPGEISRNEDDDNLAGGEEAQE
jgi:N utilization substance protein A